MSTLPGDPAWRDAGLLPADPDLPLRLGDEPPADPDDYVPPPARPDLDAAADEADVAEQAAEVPVDDEEDAGL